MPILAAARWPVSAMAGQARANASYQIAVRLDPVTKTLDGRETITYFNDSPDTLPDLWLHLYLNAFRSPDTHWMREAHGASRGFTYDPARAGWIDVTALSMTGGIDLLPSSAVSETLLHVPLPQPLRPHQAIRLDVAWKAQLPRVFARTGYAGDFVLAGQWYPKMAVYDRGRWNNIQFHANSEFFADFGTYDVSITVPTTHIVGATGTRVGEIQNSDGSKTYRYYAEDVTDFVWTSSPHYAVADRRAGSVDIVLLFQPEHIALVERYLDAAQRALESYSRWFGPYPHPRLTVVDPPDDAGGAGGMEYPTLITVGLAGLPDYPALRLPEYVTVHELAHQWWPMMVATNEMTEPWLDEGFAEYAAARWMEQAFGRHSVIDTRELKLGGLEMRRAEYIWNPRQVRINARSWEMKNYGGAAYAKPFLVLRTLENYLGEDRMLALMRTYVDRWRWRHPRTEDFIAVANEVSGENLDWFFKPLVYGTGVVDYAVNHASTHRDADGYTSRVVVTRLGDVTLPVEVQVDFADSSTRLERWDGQATQKEYTYQTAAPLVSALADPQRKLAVEVNVLDNGWTVATAEGPPLELSGRWLGFVQGLLQLMGFFG